MCILCDPQADLTINWLYCSVCPTLTSIPDALTRLECISMYNCPLFTTFATLPSNLSRLSYIYIENCPLFISLPQGMINLNSITIRNCPLFTNLPSDYQYTKLSPPYITSKWYDHSYRLKML